MPCTHAVLCTPTPCIPGGTPYVHPDSHRGGDDSHVHPGTTQAQPPAPRAPPATCTTAAAPPHARHLRAPPSAIRQATALPGRTCTNTPAPHSRRHPTGPLPRLRLTHTWSRLHPCAPTGAGPRCGTLLTSTLARHHAWPCTPTRAGTRVANKPTPPAITPSHNDTPTPALHPEAAAPSTCTYMLPTPCPNTPTHSLTPLPPPQ